MMLSTLSRCVPPTGHLVKTATSLSFAARTLSTTSGRTHLIINAVGKDRLGIVSDVSGLVIDAGGNVGDSQGAKLGEYFSLMMMVDLPAGSSEEATIIDLKKKLHALNDMSASIFPAEAEDSTLTPAVAYSAKFQLSGADNPGIVHQITKALASYGLSIDKMETDQDIAPYGGAILFQMRCIANATSPLASGFDAEKIKKKMIELGDSLNCDVEMTDAADDNFQASFYAG